MAHFIVEHTNNIDDKLIHDLFIKVHELLIASKVFPVGGIRSRAVKCDNYYIADGKNDYAFVHITMKMGSGRDIEVRKQIGDEIFAIVDAHFVDFMEKHALGITFEIQEIHPILTYKKNNIHQLIKSQQSL